MRHLSGSLPVRAAAAGLLVSALTAISGCGGSSGGAATAAVRGVQNVASTGVHIVQHTVREVSNIPKQVFDLANHTLASNNNTAWGQPQTVIVHDAYFVLIYPTPAAEQKRTGMPRMIVIPRNEQTDPQPF